MWTERDPEQIARTVAFIDGQLAGMPEGSVEAEQYIRIRETLSQHLGGAVVEPAISFEPVDEPTAVEETVTEPFEPEFITWDEIVEDLSVADAPDEETEDTIDIVEQEIVEAPVIERDPYDRNPFPIGPLAATAPIPAEVPVEVEEPREISPLVESGYSGLWSSKRHKPKREYTPGERWIRTMERRMQAEQWGDALIRFDPNLGTYNSRGMMYADATESPVIRKNLDSIVEVATHLSHLSQDIQPGQDNVVVSMDSVFEELGFAGLDALAKRQIIREVNRILSPSQALYTRRSYRTQEWEMCLRTPFSFVVTELQSRQHRKRTGVEYHESACTIVDWNAPEHISTEEWIKQQLLEGKVPMPGVHQQAVMLLNVTMGGREFVESFQGDISDSTIQAILDLSHSCVQNSLGWNGYIAARDARMFRSGRAGFSGVVRQVTGSQEQERFEKTSIDTPYDKNA